MSSHARVGQNKQIQNIEKTSDSPWSVKPNDIDTVLMQSENNLVIFTLSTRKRGFVDTEASSRHCVAARAIRNREVARRR